MFNMSDWSKKLSTEKSYTCSFKVSSLDSVALNPSEILPRQSSVGKLTLFCQL